jgi:hypothetical protein
MTTCITCKAQFNSLTNFLLFFAWQLLFSVVLVMRIFSVCVCVPLSQRLSELLGVRILLVVEQLFLINECTWIMAGQTFIDIFNIRGALSGPNRVVTLIIFLFTLKLWQKALLDIGHMFMMFSYCNVMNKITFR